MVFKKQLENNTYIDKGDYFEVTVNNSDLIYKVDSEDVEWMQGYTWYTDKAHGLKYPYLTTKMTFGIGEENRRNVKFHIHIMQEEIDRFIRDNPEYTKRIVIDHIKGDITDNRRSNLRVRTQSENNMNKKIQSNNTSGFVGVTWHNKQKMWNAIITVREDIVELGSYYYLRNALRARIDAEKEYFGEHAFYLRDECYRLRVEDILNLPSKPEPVMTPRYKTKTGHIGVGYYNGRYRANFKGKSKEFKTLQEAINQRQEWWREEYGDRPMMHRDEREERQI